MRNSIIRSSKKGFTIVELMLAVALFSLVVGTVTILSASTFRQSAGKIQQSLMHGYAAVISANLETDLAQATAIVYPAIGGNSGTSLIGMVNVVYLGAGQWSTPPGLTGERFQYLICGTQLYYWRWTVTDNASANRVQGCSSPGPQFLTAQAVQAIPGNGGAWVFSRLSANQIAVSLDLRIPKSASQPQLDLQLNRQLNAEAAEQAL